MLCVKDWVLLSAPSGYTPCSKVLGGMHRVYLPGLADCLTYCEITACAHDGVSGPEFTNSESVAISAESVQFKEASFTLVSRTTACTLVPLIRESCIKGVAEGGLSNMCGRWAE